MSLSRIIETFLGRPLAAQKLGVGIQGCIYLLVLAGAVLGVVYFLFHRQRFLGYQQRTLKVILFLLFFAAAAASSLWVRHFNPTGDEPYYLLSAHSLAEDGDLNFYDAARQQQWRRFYRGELSVPDECFSMFSKNGRSQYYYLPGIGTVLAITPGYKLAGRLGVLLTTSLVGAWILVTVYHCAQALLKERRAALAGALLTAFSAPIFCYSQQNYPEIFAALLIILLVRFLFFAPASCCHYLVIGTCIGLLPVLHLKYIIVSFALLMLSLVAVWRRPGWLLLLVPPALAAAAYVSFFYHLIGAPVPFAAYRGDAQVALKMYLQPLSQLRNGSFLGLLFDQEFGLFIYAPVYLFVGLGMLLFRQMYRRHPFAGILPFLACYYLYIASVRNWHAAEFARYLVPVLPICGIFICLCLARCRGFWFQCAVWVLASTSFLVTFLVTLLPDLRYGLCNGMNPILERTSRIVGIRLTDFFPSFMCLSPWTWVLTSMYLTAIAVMTIYFYRRAKPAVSEITR